VISPSTARTLAESERPIFRSALKPIFVTPADPLSASLPFKLFLECPFTPFSARSAQRWSLVWPKIDKKQLKTFMEIYKIQN